VRQLLNGPIYVEALTFGLNKFSGPLCGQSNRRHLDGIYKKGECGSGAGSQKKISLLPISRRSEGTDFRELLNHSE